MEVKNKINKSKKAQEEMVGFALIVILVIVIGVVFLGISLRKPSSSIEKESLLVSSLLNSISSYTSECEIPESVYRNVGDLVIDCYNNQICANGQSSCEILELNLKGMLNASYLVSNGSYTKYYELNLKNSNNGQDLIKPISQGNPLEVCPSAKLSNQKSFSTGDSGNLIIMNFQVCNTD